MHDELGNQGGSDPRGVSRRRFLGATVAGGAALYAGGFPTRTWAATDASEAASPANAPWIEATIPRLQGLMAAGTLTSSELTQHYLQRIERLNPLLHAVIETNPDALAIAAHLDKQRRRGFLRGPLHGVPVLVKDNVATADRMRTTAGSLALRNSRVPADAVIVNRLRAAGAVILGKANLSEWANFRGNNSINGWSARGGFTREPYLLSFDPSGSSSGSASATAASLCAISVGTETDGSIVSPSGNNLVVGLKPTLGLVAQDGIIPIAHSQDTAGPICRTVTDAAILLGVLQSPFGPVAGQTVPTDYTPFLQRGVLRGKRIGVDQRYFTADYGGEPDIIAVAQRGLDTITALGATLVPTDTGDPFADDFKFYNDETLVLLVEFKVQIAQYLATLENTNRRTLADLIQFNRAHCPQEMTFFGQELFEMAQATSGDLNDPDYLAARRDNLTFARTNGIDGALRRDNLDAIVAPSNSYASSLAAVAGYPNLSIPAGLTPEGKPAGLWMYGGFLREPQLLAFAYDLEQALNPRTRPQFLGSVPPKPPDAGICSALLAQPSVNQRNQIRVSRHFGTGKPFKS